MKKELTSTGLTNILSTNSQKFMKITISR